MLRKTLVLLVFFGCQDPCQEDTVTQDVIWNHFAEEIQRDRVTTLERQGYSCTNERLYNAFGKAFGSRYTCTICR